jgi:hypothetical protein
MALPATSGPGTTSSPLRPPSPLTEAAAVPPSVRQDIEDEDLTFKEILGGDDDDDVTPPLTSPTRQTLRIVVMIDDINVSCLPRAVILKVTRVTEDCVHFMAGTSRPADKNYVALRHGFFWATSTFDCSKKNSLRNFCSRIHHNTSNLLRREPWISGTNGCSNTYHICGNEFKGESFEVFKEWTIRKLTTACITCGIQRSVCRIIVGRPDIGAGCIKINAWARPTKTGYAVSFINGSYSDDFGYKTWTKIASILTIITRSRTHNHNDALIHSIYQPIFPALNAIDIKVL